MKWYTRVTKDKDDLSPLVDCMAYYEAELDSARKEVNISGSLERASSSLPGIVETRFSQLQEIEAILEYLNIIFRRTKGQVFKNYMEKYNKALSSRDAEKYSDADDKVIEVAMLVNEFALLRNNFLGIMKALDLKAFQINNVTRLRVAGMEDAEIRNIYVPKVKDYSLPTNKQDQGE